MTASEAVKRIAARTALKEPQPLSLSRSSEILVPCADKYMCSLCTICFYAGRSSWHLVEEVANALLW